MPFIEFSLYADGSACVGKRHMCGGKQIRHETLCKDFSRNEIEEVELRLRVNSDDASKDDIFDGVTLEIDADGIPCAEGENQLHTDTEIALSWDQIDLLHQFLGFLLANARRLRPS